MSDKLSRRKWLDLVGTLGFATANAGLLTMAYKTATRSAEKKGIIASRKLMKKYTPDNTSFLYKGLPLSYLIGQKIITAVGRKDNLNVLEPYLDTKSIIRDYKIGGLMYMNTPHDIRNLDESEVKELAEYFQSFSRFPLFMAADNEGGMVNRIGRFYEMKSAEYYGKAFLSAKNRKKVVAELGQEARKYHKKMASLGINLNLAPCLDTVRSYENKYGCIEKFGRSYGTHPYIVSTLGGTFIDSSRNVGDGEIKNVLCCAKHFVGEGGSVLRHDPKIRGNSHEGFSILNNKQEFYHHAEPFRRAIHYHKIGAIMMSFVMTPFDPEIPSALSEKITRWLRVQYGFRGLLITDDLMMIKEVNQDINKLEKYMAEALNADIDVFLTTSAESVPKMVQVMEKLVKDKKVPFAKITRSFERIMAAKKKIGYANLIQKPKKA